MNKLLLTIVILVGSSCLLNAQMYDPFRAAAKPKNSGTGKTLLLPPPPMGTVAPAPIEVAAIMNNRAFINGTWYKIGDKVQGQEITYINDRFVGLRDKNRLKMIGIGVNRHVLGTKELP